MFRKTLKNLRRPLIAALLAGATAAPAGAESLADAMVAAYRHSALLEQNRAVLRAADEDAATALAQLRPVVQWIAEHSFQKINGLAIGRSTGIGLQAQITLYDWGRNAIAIDAAKETVLATRAALVGVEQDVLLGAVQAYLDVRSATEQVDLQANSVRVIGQEQQAASDRFEVGEITQTDVSQADAALAAARASLAAARGNLEVAREVYRAATGRAPGQLAPPPPTPALPASLEAARQIGQRSHPAILQAQRLAAAAELGVAAAAAERNPTLTGQASIGRSRELSLQSQQESTRNTLGASLSLSQTIYSGGRLPSAHRKAMARRDEARAGLLQVSRQVDEAVGRSWAGIDVARAQIGAIDEQIVAAQQAYEGVREEATLGARTTLDVLDAEQLLLEARANKISAEANLQLAHYQLLAAMGLLTVENLKLGIPTYDPSAYYNAVQDAPFTSRQGESLDRVLRALGRD
ncbi:MULTISPECIES: TolC family outer membrane protein [Paracoccus]|uniref:Outer membrane protein n=5 Tax=Paracoccus TaxID=265 RepID=A0A3D9XAX5_PARVE|nr:MULTISPECIES: TolC family outer membrane protein [Paracoccus]MDF3906918.1 TolC family outer membrane protein [Paracoccus sp. AS002]REF67665.1 outer membrane protein [Paracoccus versutus]WGR58391.1 transporter [Paracoccus versutus]WGR60871.1 transporter [Paracoccus ferrooxidans]